jgi:predicted CXXCH cytochrome family protein
VDKLLKQPQGALCGECHEEAQRASSAAAPHPPAAQQCTSCHTPHAGGETLLVARPPELCARCHATVTGQVGRAHPHPPAAAGDCLTCHEPHGSPHKGALREAQGTLCVSCHDSFREGMARRVTHAPAVKGECSSCHEPHGSASARLVREGLSEICLSCHAGEAKKAAAAPATHAPFEGGDCLSCHLPHASAHENLLSGPPAQVCAACHDAAGGAAAGAVAAGSAHAPVARGQCLACHAPHSGRKPALLRRPEARGLCLSCHEEQARALSRTDLTRHAPFESDSCLACHAPHTSAQERLLRSPAAELCATCHDTASPDLNKAHRGLLGARSDCAGCHEGHASESKKLLLRVQHPPFGQGECAACHAEGGP